jgi:hypothetical protein
VSPANLVAGVYNATPFLVDEETNTERPGFGIQFLISDNKIIKNLVVFINILALMIPIVALIVAIYFIPWFSLRKMRILRGKMGLEEKEIEYEQHTIEKKDSML